MKKREFVIPLLLILLTHLINSTTYENAEDGTTNGWSAYAKEFVSSLPTIEMIESEFLNIESNGNKP